MSITLYRSGHLTPLHQRSNAYSRAFDSASLELLKTTSNRSSSVYAAPSLEIVETRWKEYRSNFRGLDSTIYSIKIPETLLNEEIYAYRVSPYEEFGYYSDTDEPEAAATYLSDYFFTRISIKEWESKLFPLDCKAIAKYEVLIPDHLINLCEMNPLTKEDRRMWTEQRKNSKILTSVRERTSSTLEDMIH